MSTSTQATQPLDSLSRAGVSIWLDELSRTAIRDGALRRDVDERHVVGVTTNPSIFAKAVSESDAYDEQVRDLAARGVSVDEAVRMITTADVRDACDVLRDVYDSTGGVDGRVSIEVDPRFAYDTAATIAEARQLWWLVDRPNAMIKIPATKEGLPAIEQAIADGISVNVTLIFSLERYNEVIDAYMAGLRRAADAGRDLSTIVSVASFFVSRVDAAVDEQLPQGHVARGAVAIANARLAMELYEQRFDGHEWEELAERAAHPQRPLWASTSVKDPQYPDTMYVDELVTRGVVNTMPPSTLAAVADHSHVTDATDTITGAYEDARAAIESIEAEGVSLAAVTQQLEEEGVKKFADAWQELLDHVAESLRR